MTVTGMDAEITQELAESWRFVICGDNSLAYRLADELANRYGGDVVVIVKSRASTYGSRIAALAGIRVVEADRPHPDGFAEVDLSTVDALGLVESSDVDNIDAALAAHEINPDLRMVVRTFNPSLGQVMRGLSYCTVLSDGAMAAPSFVAAALGETSTSFSVRNETMYVARRQDVRRPGDIVCGLAITEAGAEPEVLPRDQDLADLVLVEASRATPAVARRSPALVDRYPIRAVMARVWRRVRFVLGLFAVVLLLTGTVLAALSPSVGGLRAFYTAVMVSIGGTDVDPNGPAADRVILFILAIVSFLLIPFLIGGVVDAVVKARLDLAEGSVPRRASGHVVVVGLGGVGSSVIQMLNDQGVDVIGIDRSADARGAQLARDLRIPLIVGDATRTQTLLDASVPTCRALMVITSDDVTNLETALIGRTIPRKTSRQLQVVLRLFDGEFAARIQRAFQLGTSRSVSYLAVPSFAARMLGKELDTIAVGRRVLLLAELEINADSTLARGCTVGDLYRPGEGWFVGMTTIEGKRLPSTTARGRRLHYGEKVVVVATRRGLARLTAEAASPPPSEPRPPIVVFESPRAQP